MRFRFVLADETSIGSSANVPRSDLRPPLLLYFTPLPMPVSSAETILARDERTSRLMPNQADTAA